MYQANVAYSYTDPAHIQTLLMGPIVPLAQCASHHMTTQHNTTCLHVEVAAYKSLTEQHTHLVSFSIAHNNALQPKVTTVDVNK